MNLYKVPLVYRQIVALTIFLFVGILSLIPTQYIPPESGLFQLDKLVHFIMYLALSWSVLLAFDIAGKPRKRIVIWVLVVGYGILLEFLQGILPIGRQFSYYDMIANLTGCISGLYIHYRSYKSLIND